MATRSTSAHCPRCGATFPIPRGLAHRELRALAAIHAEGSHLEFIKRVREATGYTLRDAKGLMLHVTHRAECHWCGDPIPTAAIADCSCGSTNVDLTLLE